MSALFARSPASSSLHARFHAASLSNVSHQKQLCAMSDRIARSLRAHARPHSCAPVSISWLTFFHWAGVERRLGRCAARISIDPVPRASSEQLFRCADQTGMRGCHALSARDHFLHARPRPWLPNAWRPHAFAEVGFRFRAYAWIGVNPSSSARRAERWTNAHERRDCLSRSSIVVSQVTRPATTCVCVVESPGMQAVWSNACHRCFFGLGTEDNRLTSIRKARVCAASRLRNRTENRNRRRGQAGCCVPRRRRSKAQIAKAGMLEVL